MPDSEIAIDAPTGIGMVVIALCDADGNALCLAHVERDK